jgi:hypothetical protein
LFIGDGADLAGEAASVTDGGAIFPAVGEGVGMGFEEGDTESEEGGGGGGEEEEGIEGQDTEEGWGGEVGEEGEELVTEVELEDEAGAVGLATGGAVEVMDDGLGDEVGFDTGEPGAVAEVGFLVVAEEGVIKEEAAGEGEDGAAEDHAGAFGAEDGVGFGVGGVVGFVVTDVVGEAEAGEEGAADIEGMIEFGEEHFALGDTDFGMFEEVLDEGFEEVWGDGGIVIEEEDEFTGAVLESEVIAAGEAEVGGALDCADCGVVLE